MVTAADAPKRYRVYGANASPYSVKMRAILRYRRLPFDWVLAMPQLEPDKFPVRPLIIPIVAYPEDGSLHVDSTPIAYELEERHPGVRSIMPDDAGHAFLCALLEDFADEWMTKPMFWHRWARPIDQAATRAWIASDVMSEAPPDARDRFAHMIAERQIGRMDLVGCSRENAPVLEESYRRVLDAFAARISSMPFLFGTRPSLADFAFFGQLTQLATDPTPQAIMRDHAPAVVDWVRRLDDASGVEGAWVDRNTAVDGLAGDLLELAGTLYFPFLDANARAAASGDDEFETELLGAPYRQGVFRYQVKCLARLRELYSALDRAVRARVDPVLDRTGCLAFLTL